MSRFVSQSNLDHEMCAEPEPASLTDSARLLATIQSALIAITQHQPLDTVLAGILRAIEAQQAGLQCAVILQTDDALGLRVAAAPGLAIDYFQALEQLLRASDPHAISDFLASPMAVQDIYASAFWSALQQASAQHGMQACWALPIQSLTKGGLGLFVLHASTANLAQADAQQVALAVLPLTLLAISHALESRAPRSPSNDIDARIALALETSQIGIWDRLIPAGEVYYSGRWKALLGYSPTEDIGVRLEDAYKRIHPDDLARIQGAMQAHFAGQTEDYSAEYRIRCKDDSYKWFLSRGRVVSRAPDGQPLRMVGAMVDITERKRLELELQEWATTDFLTQLPNRRQFMVALEDALLRRRRFGRQAALVMCDLDYFKHINDCFGHATGDLVLQHFAAILRHELRQFDAVGRVGGEEFALVLTGASANAAQAFAERVRARVANTPLMLETKRGQFPQAISITVSIGVTLIRDTDGNADICLSRSDAALYRAKTLGRDRVEMG